MTEKMLKYEFLVFYKEFDMFIELLKQAGVVHIKQVKQATDDDTQKIKQQLVQLKQIKKSFEQILVSTSPIQNQHQAEFNITEIAEHLNQYANLQKQYEKLKEAYLYAQHFGNFELQKLVELQKSHIYFHLYSVASGKFKPGWFKKHLVEIIFETHNRVFFVVITNNAKKPILKAQIEEFPEKTAININNSLQKIEEEKNYLITAFHKYETQIFNYIKNTYQNLKDQLQNKIAENQKVSLGFGKVVRMVGWIPEDKTHVLDKLLENKPIYFEKHQPLPVDDPPIKFRNNSFNTWFEPISKLFALPNYRELDLTPFFAPFFLLFFGFCLGDGGYGLIILLVLLAVKNKIPPAYKNIWKLAIALEFVAIFMGIVSATFFGINLLETNLPFFSSLKPIMLNADELFNLALILGSIQIFYGLVLKAINQKIQFGWAYAISPIGWIFLLFALGFGYLNQFNLLIKIMAWLGLGLIIAYSDPKAGIGVRLGKGLWDLYGITGFFGDLLSYIRLFALGLAGSILGFVVNDIALSILGDGGFFNVIFFVVMLLIGHSLNIFIASLGAFVHPMRLTFVEFYKNAGFTGGGEAYQPLKQLKK